MFTSVGKSGGRNKRWHCYLAMSACRKQGEVLLHRAYNSTVMLRQLELCCSWSCWNHHYHCFSGCQVLAWLLTPRAQESTVPLKLVGLIKLKLPVTCDGCCCFTTADPLLQSAVLRAISRVLCHRGCWSTIAQISSVKNQREGKILSDFLPVLSILTKQSGKCSFQVSPQKRAWAGWDVVENHRQIIYIEFKIFLLMGV